MPHLQRLATALFSLLLFSLTSHAQLSEHSPNLPKEVTPSWWQQVQRDIQHREYFISQRPDKHFTSPNRA